MGVQTARHAARRHDTQPRNGSAQSARQSRPTCRHARTAFTHRAQPAPGTPASPCRSSTLEGGRFKALGCCLGCCLWRWQWSCAWWQGRWQTSWTTTYARTHPLSLSLSRFLSLSLFLSLSVRAWLTTTCDRCLTRRTKFWRSWMRLRTTCARSVVSVVTTTAATALSRSRDSSPYRQLARSSLARAARRPRAGLLPRQHRVARAARLLRERGQGGRARVRLWLLHAFRVPLRRL